MPDQCKLWDIIFRQLSLGVGGQFEGLGTLFTPHAKYLGFAPSVLVYGAGVPDQEALEQIISAIYEFSSSRNQALSPNKFSKLVCLFYSDYLKMGGVSDRQKMTQVLSTAVPHSVSELTYW